MGSSCGVGLAAWHARGLGGLSDVDGVSGDSAESLCGVGLTAWHASWTESAAIPRNRYVAWASLLGTRAGWTDSAESSCGVSQRRFRGVVMWRESKAICRSRHVA